MYVDVDMGGCGFKAAPIVTTSLEGEDGSPHLMLGAASVQRVTQAGFSIEIRGYANSAYQIYKTKPSPDNAKFWKWTINWSAFGYFC